MHNYCNQCRGTASAGSPRITGSTTGTTICRLRASAFSTIPTPATIGSGVALNTVTVSPYTSGTIRQFLVSAGTVVKKDQVIAELDAETEQIAVERAEVALRTKTAQALYERMLPAWQTSLDNGIVPFVHPITARILQQQEIIANAENAIKEIIEDCKHPSVNVIVEHKGDTGNWAQSDDSYARKETCSLCGRHEYWNKNHGERDYTLLTTTNHRLPIKK